MYYWKHLEITQRQRIKKYRNCGLNVVEVFTGPKRVPFLKQISKKMKPESDVNTFIFKKGHLI